MQTHAPSSSERRPPRPAPAILARGVRQRLGGTDVVNGLDIEVSPGTIFGFIGPSGSGKTTTIRMLTGIQQPTEGRVEVLGKPPAAFSTKDRARIGYLPQLSVLFPELSLWQNLSFVASIYGLGWPRRRRLRRVLELVELWDDRRKRLRDASGGMQRRLALAAALVHDPEVMFLDEPTAGVDPVLRRKFWERLEALRDEGRTLFVTTQYVGEAAYCDVVGVISDGWLVALDTPDGLRRRALGGQLLDIRTVEPVDEATMAQLCRLQPVLRCDRVGADGQQLRVVVERAAEAVPRIADWFDDRGVPLESIREEQPPFDDVFVALVQGGRS